MIGKATLATLAGALLLGLVIGGCRCPDNDNGDGDNPAVRGQDRPQAEASGAKEGDDH